MERNTLSEQEDVFLVIGVKLLLFSDEAAEFQRSYMSHSPTDNQSWDSSQSSDLCLSTLCDTSYSTGSDTTQACRVFLTTSMQQCLVLAIL